MQLGLRVRREYLRNALAWLTLMRFQLEFPCFQKPREISFDVAGLVSYEFEETNSTPLKSRFLPHFSILLPRVSKYIPLIIVGAIIGTSLVITYSIVILNTATPTTPKVTWATSPLTISFTGLAGSGSAADGFTCKPGTNLIVMRTVSNSPATIAISVSPLSLASCGSTPQSVTVSVACLVPADQCRGSYTGLVQVRQPANYRDLAANLNLQITVT